MHEDHRQLVEYLMAQFAGTVQERALLAALDGRSRIKDCSGCGTAPATG